MKKRYIDGLFGQVHLVENDGPSSGQQGPLFCLHATAYSSQTFKPLMSAIGDGRKVYALDTPGYGGSDRPAVAADMGGYADAFIDSVERLAAAPVDVLGYHSGVYIAAEAAIRRPELFRRLVMIGVPFFHGEGSDAWRTRLTKRHSLTEDLHQFDERWSFFVANRPSGVWLERGFENFIDELRAYPHGSRMHEALMSYDDLVRLRLVRTPVLVINPPGHLAEGSRQAAALMPNAEILEMPDLSQPVLETSPSILKDEIAHFLDRV